jgi:hypothetical protein
MSKLHAFQSVLSERPLDEYPYVEKYVAFLDILGFKKLVEIADADSSIRADLVKVIQVFRTTCGEHASAGTRIAQFSDSLIITANRTEMGLKALFHGCQWLTINLVQYGVLLRGGIALGGVTHESDALFGVGINRAHAFEARDTPPRIGVDKAVVTDLSDFSELSSGHYLTTNHANGEFILHTLRELEFYNPNPPLAGMIVWDRHAKDIADLIRERIGDLNMSQYDRRKWEWLGKYWNISVGSKGILARV